MDAILLAILAALLAAIPMLAWALMERGRAGRAEGRVFELQQAAARLRVLEEQEEKNAAFLQARAAEAGGSETEARTFYRSAAAYGITYYGQLAAAKSELSSMRGNSAWLRAEVAERQARVEVLEARIAELEAEETANIVTLPRNAVTPSIDDIWGEDEHPTMVDLAKLNLDVLPELRREA